METLQACIAALLMKTLRQYAILTEQFFFELELINTSDMLLLEISLFK